MPCPDWTTDLLLEAHALRLHELSLVMDAVGTQLPVLGCHELFEVLPCFNQARSVRACQLSSFSWYLSPSLCWEQSGQGIVKRIHYRGSRSLERLPGIDAIPVARLPACQPSPVASLKLAHNAHSTSLQVATYAATASSPCTAHSRAPF